MLKRAIKKGGLILNKKYFCIKSSDFLYPDQIVSKLNKTLNDGGDLTEVEAEILEKLNFFDADQFVDTVSLLAYANKGTEMLWDILSRKIYDYELDVAQTYMLTEVLNNCNKHDYFMMDELIRSNMTWDLKWPKAGKLFTEKLL